MDEIGFEATRRADQVPPYASDSDRESFAWDITLTYQGRKLVIPFYTGKGLVDIPKNVPARDRRPDGTYYSTRARVWVDASPRVPTLEDVGECLVSDAAVRDGMSFEDWADDYGYDKDSRAAERVYRGVIEQTDKLRVLFGADFRAFCEDPRFGGEF